MRRFISVLLLFMVTIAGPLLAQYENISAERRTDTITMKKMKVVAYVPNWTNLFVNPGLIDYSKLTHINIAFENPDTAGNLSWNPGNQALIEKAHENGVKVLVSIGGGAESGDSVIREKYFRLINDSNRYEFISKISAYIVYHDLDGLDVDLEGPAINSDYGNFIRVLSDSLKPRGKILTAALSRGYGGTKVTDETLQYFDFINIMAYDATGPWNRKNAGQHSSYALAESHLKYWKSRGLSQEKAILGVPFYGYGFRKDYSQQTFSYSYLLENYSHADKKDKVGRRIYYNGIPTIKRKTRLAMQQGGGIMIWELSSDAFGAKSLLLAIDQAIKGMDYSL